MQWVAETDAREGVGDKKGLLLKCRGGILVEREREASTAVVLKNNICYRDFRNVINVI